MKHLLSLLLVCLSFVGFSQYTLNVTTSSAPETDAVYIIMNNVPQIVIQFKDSLPNTQYSYPFTPAMSSTLILHTTSDGTLEALDDMGVLVDLCPSDTYSNAVNNTTPYEITLSPQFGCTYDIALNYDPNIQEDDGSCIFDCVSGVDGCLYENAANYDPNANYDSGGNCDFAVNLGCTYVEATNYDPVAVQDDGSCEGFTSVNTCPADLDGNGSVSAGDLLAILAVFGTDCPDEFSGDVQTITPVDFNGDAGVFDLQGNLLTTDVSKIGSLGSGAYMIIQGKHAIFIRQ